LKKDDSHEKARAIAQLALSKKAEDIRILDVRKFTNVTDFFVICHGDVDLQVKAIQETIDDGMRDIGVKVWHKEGYQYNRWVVLDYVDVVVHVFLKEMRDFYNLERLWGDADIETIEDGET